MHPCRAKLNKAYESVLPLFVFIDACGWEIIKNDPFVRAFAPNRRRLTSVFGYSSACVPSILSGRWPVEHRNWSYFVYDPHAFALQILAAGLRWLPAMPHQPAHFPPLALPLRQSPS